MYQLTPRGAFSLQQSVDFAYVDREPATAGEALLLGFCADGTWEPTVVAVTQHGTTVSVDGDRSTRSQVERILGLEHDATGFAEVGRRDPVIGRLQELAPGLRPPQLHSAYEAAVFCILTARRSAAQARSVRAALAREAGTVLRKDGVDVTCLPPPSVLVDAPEVRGLDRVRRERLVAVAQAALDGRLDTAELAALDPEEARTRLEELAGIGPFSSAIIVVRSLGHTDYLAGPITELNTTVGALYDLGHDASPDELVQIAESWAPWRMWAQLHVRSVGPRLLAD